MDFFDKQEKQTLQESFIGCLICTIYIDEVASDEELQDLVMSYSGRSIFIGFDCGKALEKQILRRAVDEPEDILKECCLGITEEWKQTVFMICCDLIFKDRIITDDERDFLKRMKDYMGLSDETAGQIINAMLILYKGKI